MKDVVTVESYSSLPYFYQASLPSHLYQLLLHIKGRSVTQMLNF